MKNKVGFLIILGLITASILYFANTKLHFVSKIKNKLHPKENIVFVDVNKKPSKTEEKPEKTADLTKNQTIEKTIEKPTLKKNTIQPKSSSKKNYIAPKKNYISVIPLDDNPCYSDNSGQERPSCYHTKSHRKPLELKQEYNKYTHSNICKETMPVLPPAPIVKPCCSDIKVYTIEYTDAKALCKFINRNLKHKKSRKIAVLKNSNQIILYGTKEELCLAEAVINKLDEKPQTAVFRVAYTDPCKMANMLSYTIFEGKKSVKKQKPSPKGRIINDIYFNNEQNTITINGATARQIELANQFVKLTDKCPSEANIELVVMSFAQDNTTKFNQVCNIDCKEKHFTISTKNFNTTIQELEKTGNGIILAQTTKTLKNTQSCQINLYEELNKCKKIKRKEKKLFEQIAMNITLSPLISFNNQTFLSINPSYSFIKKTTKRIFNTDKCAIQKSINLKNIPLNECETLVISCDVFSQDYIKHSKLRCKNEKLVIFARIKE